MLTYEEFKNHVAENIKDYLPDYCQADSVSIIQVRKNNLLSDGLMIKATDNNITPNIYLNGIYEQYTKMPESLIIGKDPSLDIVMESIADTYVKHRIDQNIDLKWMISFDKVKDRVYPFLMSIKGNEEYLSDKPYVKVADLACIFKVKVHEMDDHSAIASFDVTNSHADMWGVSPDVLMHLAKDNLDKFEGPSITTMKDIIYNMLNDGMPDEMSPDDIDLSDIDDNMFILSNNLRIQGASVILSDSFMDTVKETIGSDAYIIPSSIHEVIAVPTSCCDDYTELEEMVHDINATQVKPEERLSDNVYRYDFNGHELYLASEHLERQSELNFSNAVAAGRGR